MRLSETSSAVKWLHQFASPDQAIARRLIDDLIVVSPEEFFISMRELVRPILGSHRQTIAVYPIWEVERPERASRWAKRLGSTESVFPLTDQEDTETGSTHFDVKEPSRRGTKPINEIAPAPKLGITGSVGSIVHTISDLHKELGHLLLDRPALSVLRATKCRHIVLVDDILASGDRAISYLEAFYKHPTIKSWCSNPGLTITIVCYAASAAALQKIGAYRKRHDPPRPSSVEVRFVQQLNRGRSFWSPEHLLAIDALCRKYAPLTSRPKIPLGYSDALNMVVFPHSVPNTVPALLWAGSTRWQPLFPNRVVPETLWKSMDTSNEDYGTERLVDTLQQIGQLRLAKADWSHHATPEYRRLILLLAVTARGFRELGRLSEIMEETPLKCGQLLAVARTFHLISENGSLTREGHAELEHARTVGRLPSEVPPLNEERVYFPKSLRESRGSI